MQKFLIIVLGLFIGFTSNAQSLNVVKGKVLNADTSEPIANVVVSVQDTDITQSTGSDGTFVLQNVPKGEQIIVIKKDGFESQFFPSTITDTSVDLGEILLYVDLSQQIDNSVVTLTEDDLSDDEAGGADNIAGILQSSKDTYQRAVAFNFGQVWFKERGYDSSYGQVSFNGMPMNKISNNRPQWSDWGGLNDVLRNQEFTNGLAASETTFGGVLGTTNFITRASKNREGGKISYSVTNSNYNGRAMASYNTGLMDNGWALSVLGSRRYAQEGYMEGSSYNAWGGFIAVEKVLNEKHSLNFTAFYTPNRRGKNSPNTQEVYDLGGLKYNSYWGWQEGEKRNSRMKEIKEPTFMLGHYWEPSKRTSINTNIMYQDGTIGNSRLGYYKALNPDPTYYQKLPSYDLAHVGDEDWESAYQKAQKFLTDAPESQIIWGDLYEANNNLIDNPSAVYYLYEDVNDDTTIAINSTINTQIDNNITLNGAILYKNIQSENYARMMDLLGAPYFEDKDQYSSDETAQNDLNNPNRRVVVGDKFNYDYNISANIADAFIQGQFKYDKVDFYIASNIGKTGYQREGLYKNGHFSDSSYGKGEIIAFTTYGTKAGITYKFSGRHLLNINGGYIEKAPSLRNTFNNSRVNHSVVPNITTEKILSTDASYIYRAPGVKARLTGYYTKFKDLNEVAFYYADGINIGMVDIPDNTQLDGSTSTSYFVNTTLSGVEKKHFGGEFGIDVQVTPTVSIQGAAALGQFTYDNNPDFYIGTSNFPSSPVVGEKTYLKNYKLSGTPQRGYSLGFSYRDPKYWWISTNANLLSNNYVSISPFQRTDNFFTDTFGNPVPFNDLTQEQVDAILDQEKFDDIFLVNLVGGKSWKIKDKYFGFFASINNLLGETFKTGGFEQARKANYETLSEDESLNTPTFGNKYWYGRGTSYYINFYVRF